MNLETKRLKAHSYDLDDTLIGREGITRIVGLATGKLKSHHFPPYNATNLPVINREPVDETFSTVSERISFKVHSLRNILPGVQIAIQQDVLDGIDVYGNTGRSNKRLWTEMTNETLRKGGIKDFFQDVFYTPDGVKTAVSKAVALQQLLKTYKEVSHFEDDPRTAAYLATLFPELEVYLIHYGSTGLLYSREEINQFPNIHRIGSLEELRK